QRRLDGGGGRRAPQIGAVEDLLENLRVHLDAGNALAKRRGLVIEKPQARDADQHQLVAKKRRGRVLREHVVRGDVARRIMRAKIDAKTAVGLQRYRRVGDLERDALATAVLQPQEWRAGRHAQQVDGECR